MTQSIDWSQDLPCPAGTVGCSAKIRQLGRSSAPSSGSDFLGIETISLSPSSVTIYENEQNELTARGSDQLGRTFELTNVLWISDNPAVVTVNQSGIVTAPESYRGRRFNLSLIERPGKQDSNRMVNEITRVSRVEETESKPKATTEFTPEADPDSDEVPFG